MPLAVRGSRAPRRQGQGHSPGGSPVKVNLQTLRYYERRGLLIEPERTLGGHRLYPPEAVTIVGVIKTAQRLGFTLDEVADLLETARHPHGHHDTGLQERARRKLIEVERRIADLQIIRTTLHAAVEAGCDDLLACAQQPCCPLPFTELAHPDPQEQPRWKPPRAARP